LKTLFASYSFEGNCRELSRLMAEAVGGDAEELTQGKSTIS
jgi:transcriptional regulator with AAA-type ATPase domain